MTRAEFEKGIRQPGKMQYWDNRTGAVLPVWQI